jgi:AcrR family transcriptional regulator
MTNRKQLGEVKVNAILDAAAAVFAQKGFHQATTKEIAKAAGVAEGTIYNYFANKRDLLLGLLRRLGEMSQLEQVKDDPQHNAKQYYIEDARQGLVAFQSMREVWRAVLPEILVDAELRVMFLQSLNSNYVQYVEEYLRKRVEQGELKSIENYPLTVRLMQSIPIGLLILTLLDDPIIQTEWENLPEAMANLVYDGLKRKHS